mgnify:CR=1 FL=1
MGHAPPNGWLSQTRRDSKEKSGVREPTAELYARETRTNQIEGNEYLDSQVRHRDKPLSSRSDSWVLIPTSSDTAMNPSRTAALSLPGTRRFGSPG